MPEQRLPLPPFTQETALQKVQAAEDAWNTRELERVAAASINDVAIDESERRIFGTRPESERRVEFPLR
jgi:hypothetical protein